MEIAPDILQEVKDAHAALAARGELLSEPQLQQAYSTFRQRFGPEILGVTDGLELLELMHTHGNKSSLVYWLEFKDDDDFPGAKFGSIAGGSAHKFGLFRRSGTDQWVSGVGNDITEAQAIDLARSHKAQLLHCVDALENLPENASEEAYLNLQTHLLERAPSVVKTGWAHKYLHLLFPTKLDNYHTNRYQRHHLLKLLVLPPEHDGLYALAPHFVRLAVDLGMPMIHLTASLNERNGPPVQYWRLGTKLGMGPDAQDIWPDMRDGQFAAIGWDATGDLSPLRQDKGFKEAVRDLLTAHYYPDDARTASRKAGEMAMFSNKWHEGDIVLAANGAQIVGIGRVTGPYTYEATPPTGAPHRRAMDWLSFGAMPLPKNKEGLLTTVSPMVEEPGLLEIEQVLRQRLAQLTQIKAEAVRQNSTLNGIPGRIQAILKRKGQVILYGPPGTGKTYWARSAAADLAALAAFGKRCAELADAEKAEIDGKPEAPGLVRCCTFHPAYGYEDFLEGFRPSVSQGGTLVFEPRTGIFKKLCEDARLQPHRDFFLLVDEINRGDIPRIFGELLTLLEADKRGMSLQLPVSGEAFSIPKNVHVIGTMNTADRSIALLDTALRRRFGFIELMPDTELFRHTVVGGVLPLGAWLSALNDRVRSSLGRDARNLQIGHAYFLHGGKPVFEPSHFARILAEDVIPLLEEYCYEDYSALSKILGHGLVDETRQCVREELLAHGRQEELLQALLGPAPEIATSSEVAIEEEQDETVAEEDAG